jgi:hypothetical protein
MIGAFDLEIKARLRFAGFEYLQTRRAGDEIQSWVQLDYHFPQATPVIMA